MTVRPLIELPLLAAIWGASFIFMKLGGAEFGPFLFMAIRTLIASVFLLPLLLLNKQHLNLNGYYVKIFIMAMFSTAIPFILFGWATLTLTAGITSVLNATTPMFGAIVAFLWLKDKLSLSAVFGLILGFIGVYFLMYDKLVIAQEDVILPTLAVMLASLCYGISANFTKRYLTGVKPLALATGSQVSATLVLLPISLFFLPETIPSDSAMLSVLLLGILCTGIAYVIFFRLITFLGPTKAISVTYLIPVFGLFWGVIFLNEIITSWMMLGCGFVLSGVALTTGAVKLRKKTTITQF
ncbi:MAG: DMT family transporter [Colwellia sp.]|nr:DMT family transporter [Colwellia sp.]